MVCPNLETCPFINNPDEKLKDDIIKYKNKFCNADYEKCARFILSNTTVEVPVDLAPDEIKRLEKLMKT
ncbi:MAG: hypothetical protein ABF633_16840 [Clostridium sp.]|uniref:hypothetical protein n=1 Tax=Clostridium sp. TaxID=1506 RepID=UPI0039EB26B1